MKLEDIDHLFKNNERQFDQMPDEQVWSRLEQRLAEPVSQTSGSPAMQKDRFRLQGFWRYAAAAAIVLVILSPVAMYLLGITGNEDKKIAVKTAAEQPGNYELMESADSEQSVVLLNTEKQSALNRSDARPDNYSDTGQTITAMSKTESKPQYSEPVLLQKPAEKELSGNLPATTETKQRNYPTAQPPNKVGYAPPAAKPATQPSQQQRMATGTAVRNEESTDEKSYYPETLSKPTIPPVNPPLSDLAYSRYYIGLAQDGLQEKEQNLPIGNTSYDYNAAPPVTNNSGKPYMAPADVMRDESKTTTQKKQSAKQVAPAAGSKDDAPATITQKNITWLWGNWISAQNNTTITENWQPSGKANISSMVNGNTYFTETAAIKPSGKGLVYTISNPQTGNSTTYQLSGYATANNLIFENKDNTIAYPGIIAYHLISDNTLYVTFTGFDPNGQPLQTTLQYQKQ